MALLCYASCARVRYMETVNRYRFTDALFLLIAVLLVSAVLILQPFSVHVPVVPVVPATVVTLNACGSRAAQGNWNPNMFEGSQYDTCRAYYPMDNSVVSAPTILAPVAP